MHLVTPPTDLVRSVGGQVGSYGLDDDAARWGTASAPGHVGYGEWGTVSGPNSELALNSNLIILMRR